MAPVTLLFVAFVHLAASLQYVVRAAPEGPQRATCRSGGGTQTTTMLTYGTLEITCPTDSTMRPTVEKENEAKVFTSDKDDAKELELGSLVPGATLVSKDAKVHLNVPQLPAEVKAVFFRCEEKVKQQNICYIQVDIPASPPAGPNACVVPDTQLVFQASDASTVVQFSCAPHTLGQEAGKVLDENCEQELDLESVVQGAVFQPAVKPDEMVRVSFPKPPRQGKKLCYTCVCKNKKTCKVLIYVSGVDPAAALGITALTESTLGVAFIGASLLHIS